MNSDIDIIWHFIPEISDIKKSEDLIKKTKVFLDEDADLVNEILQEAINKGLKAGYEFIFAEQNGILIGFSSYGPIPTSENRYEIYWLAVDPNQQGKGLGGLLLNKTIEKIKSRSSTLVFVETSSTPEFTPARHVYERHNFTECARLKDFFADNHDKVIYTLKLK